AVWVLNDLAFWGLGGPDPATWARAAFVIALALQLSFLRFAWVFPTPRPVPWRPALLLLAPAPLYLAVALFGAPLAHVARAPGGGLELAPSGWTFALGAYVYLLFAAGALVVVARRRAALDA